MNDNRSKINGNKLRTMPSERVSEVLIEWINKIIIVRPRNTAAMIVHAAIPFVDGKKSHEQDVVDDLGKQLEIGSQVLSVGNLLGKHVSKLENVDLSHRVNRPILV